MEIAELRMEIPYNSGGCAGPSVWKDREKTRDIRFLPPTADGVSEIRGETVGENPSGLLSEFKKITKEERPASRFLAEPDFCSFPLCLPSIS